MLEDQAFSFLIIIILKQKHTSDRAKGGGLSLSTSCISHLPMVGQKRSCRWIFELKTNSKWQFAIWCIEFLCTPTLKLAETSSASQKSSLPSFSPQNTLPLSPDCFNTNSEAKESTDPGQTPAFFFCSGGQFQHPSCLWTGSLCKCLQKQQEKNGTGPEVNCQGLKRAEPLHPKAALMLASTEWIWDTTAWVTGKRCP